MRPILFLPRQASRGPLILTSLYRQGILAGELHVARRYPNQVSGRASYVFPVGQQSCRVPRPMGDTGEGPRMIGLCFARCQPDDQGGEAILANRGVGRLGHDSV